MEGWGSAAGGRRDSPAWCPRTRQQHPAVLTSGQGRPCLPSPFFRMRRMCAKNSTPSPGFLKREAGPRVSGCFLELRAPSTCLPPSRASHWPLQLGGTAWVSAGLVRGLSLMSMAWTPPLQALGSDPPGLPPEAVLGQRESGLQQGKGSRVHVSTRDAGGGHPPSPGSGGLLWVSASAPRLSLGPPAEGRAHLNLPEHTALDLQQGRHGGVCGQRARP